MFVSAVHSKRLEIHRRIGTQSGKATIAFSRPVLYPRNGRRLVEVKDWDSRANKRRTTIQNAYFTERFGRNDFSIIDDPFQTQYAVKYIVKYLEKSGERIVYSKGLYQYFISDIMDEDILCPYYGEDEKHYVDKYILFDKFMCWDEGLYMGDVCPETIAKMRKSN